MDIFSFMSNSSADLSTPIGSMIKSGTDSLLLGPDWAKNLEICDEIINTRDGNTQAIKAIQRRLQDSDHNTVYLALMIMETCMKNCGPSFAGVVNKSFMDEMSNICKGAKGDKNAYEAMRMIQQWGRAYEHKRDNFPLFFDTFVSLKSKGLKFPKEEETSSLLYERTGSTDRKSFNGTSTPAQFSSASSESEIKPFKPKEQELPPTNIDEVQKLNDDLTAVMDKVKLCRELLQESPGIEKDDLLADVIGFLEACRDRLVEVIYSGSQGLLEEEQFARCLQVNDAVLRTLDAEKNGTHIEVDEENESRIDDGKNNNASNNLLDLDSPVKSTPTSAWMDDDLFGSMELQKAGKIGLGAGSKKNSNVMKISPPPSMSASQGLDMSQTSSSDQAYTSTSAPTYNSDFANLSSVYVPPQGVNNQMVYAVPPSSHQQNMNYGNYNPSMPPPPVPSNGNSQSFPPPAQPNNLKTSEEFDPFSLHSTAPSSTQNPNPNTTHEIDAFLASLDK